MSISHLVEDLITSAGYPAVFALVGVESLGITLPGETALVLASIYAGTTHRLSLCRAGQGAVGVLRDAHAAGRQPPPVPACDREERPHSPDLFVSWSPGCQELRSPAFLPAAAMEPWLWW